MKVKLIHLTENAEKHISYCARVSNPSNQNNEKIEGLLAYCIKEQHWSIFEMANMCLEINTSRGIAQQILRHKSFSFQEFSQRYAASTTNEIYEARNQDVKNRQNSIDNVSNENKEWFLNAQIEVWDKCYTLYQEGLEKGLAKEQMRFILPISTSTRIYMNGNLRSWINYINLRISNGTQKEHSEIAKECQKIFVEQFPIISKALGWI